MKQISGSVQNYFWIYQVPINIILTAIYLIWFLDDLNENPIRLYFIFIGAMNALLTMHLYMPFYKKKCRTVFSDGDFIQIGEKRYKFKDIVSITKWKFSYVRAAFSFYSIKLKNPEGTIDYYNFANKAILTHINPLTIFKRDLYNTINFFKKCGFTKKVKVEDVF